MTERPGSLFLTRPWAKGYYLMYFPTVLEPASHNKDLLFHPSDLGFNLLKIITNVQNNRKVNLLIIRKAYLQIGQSRKAPCTDNRDKL